MVIKATSEELSPDPLCSFPIHIDAKQISSKNIRHQKINTSHGKHNKVKTYHFARKRIHP